MAHRMSSEIYPSLIPSSLKLMCTKSESSSNDRLGLKNLTKQETKILRRHWLPLLHLSIEHHSSSLLILIDLQILPKLHFPQWHGMGAGFCSGKCERSTISCNSFLSKFIHKYQGLLALDLKLT